MGPRRAILDAANIGLTDDARSIILDDLATDGSSTPTASPAWSARLLCMTRALSLWPCGGNPALLVIVKDVWIVAFDSLPASSHWYWPDARLVALQRKRTLPCKRPPSPSTMRDHPRPPRAGSAHRVRNRRARIPRTINSSQSESAEDSALVRATYMCSLTMTLLCP